MANSRLAAVKFTSESVRVGMCLSSSLIPPPLFSKSGTFVMSVTLATKSSLEKAASICAILRIVSGAKRSPAGVYASTKKFGVS